MKPNKPKKDLSGQSFAPVDIEQIERLLRFMSDNNLEEFEYSRGDLRIRLRKPSTGIPIAQYRAVGTESSASEAPAHAGAGASHSGPGGTALTQAGENLHQVKSPIVGTFYGAPTPGAEPFVKVGSHVEVGQTLCIVEAMKLMNEIESDVSGEVVRVFVESAQPVEYGQALFGIRPSRKK
jgi:acetyl-CoA carboxylase biotin carboxyl carrier protein